jgi:hypothetical protein
MEPINDAGRAGEGSESFGDDREEFSFSVTLHKLESSYSSFSLSVPNEEEGFGGEVNDMSLAMKSVRYRIVLNVELS